MKLKEAFNLQTLFMASLFLNVMLLGLTTHLTKQFQALYENVVFQAAPANPGADAATAGSGTPSIHVAGALTANPNP